MGSMYAELELVLRRLNWVCKRHGPVVRVGESRARRVETLGELVWSLSGKGDVTEASVRKYLVFVQVFCIWMKNIRWN